MRYLFISPHMDDAVLSAGSLILRLVNERKDVFIITVFTSFGTEPINRDAKEYITQSGFSILNDFSTDRKKEDICAMTILGVPWKHLNYIDGGFRKDTQNRFTYPTHTNLFSGTVAGADQKLLKRLIKDVSDFVHRGDILYGPIAIGNHADHILVRQAVEKLPNKKYYWLDQPYGFQKENRPQLDKYRETFRVPYTNDKERILSCYQSQIKLLYPKGIPAIDEVYFEMKPIR